MKEKHKNNLLGIIDTFYFVLKPLFQFHVYMLVLLCSQYIVMTEANTNIPFFISFIWILVSAFLSLYPLLLYLFPLLKKC